MSANGVDRCSEDLACKMLAQLLDLEESDAISVVAYAVARRDDSITRVEFEHLGPWGGDWTWCKMPYTPQFCLRTNYRLSPDDETDAN